MQRVHTLLASALLLCSSVTACGSVTGDTLAGGAGGAAVGAGTGALVGAVITNGDIAASALAGGVIGIPIGLAVGYALSQYDPEVQKQQLQETYLDNQSEIVEREAEIRALREEMLRDKPRDMLQEMPKARPFHGATIGSPI